MRGYVRWSLVLVTLATACSGETVPGESSGMDNGDGPLSGIGGANGDIDPNGTGPDGSDSPTAGDGAGGGDEPGGNNAGAIEAPPGWELHWNDEFDELDTTFWEPYHNTYGDGNNELACLTPNNLSVVDGKLVITAKRENVTCPGGKQRDFTSGFIGTRERGNYFPRFGRYEIRAALPHMNAMWPAFWLRHRDGSSEAEIDVMEYFHAQAPGKVTGTIHFDHKYNVAKGTHAFEATNTTPPGFHTFAVEMLPGKGADAGKVCIEFFVDGVPTRYHNEPQGAYCLEDTGPFSAHAGKPLFDIAINLAIGGNWVGHPDGPLNKLNNGNTVSTDGVQPTTFPAQYVIDYVRVFVPESE